MIEIRVKHSIHCLVYATIIWMAIKLNVKDKVYYGNECSWSVQIVLYVLEIAYPLFYLPFALSSAAGLFLYDCFPREVKLRINLDELPTICFRVVTRGTFPKLILKNLQLNLGVCREVQMRKYVIEVVTQERIEDLVEGPLVKQTVVPETYETTQGALYKARNLQYALENSDLDDSDWIVHLDEDSLLTPDAVKGVCNFVHRNEHQFGVGLIDSYVDPGVSLFTESLDIMPLLDYGNIRFHARFLNNVGWAFRTNFLVANVGAEKRVNFEMEPGASLLEDYVFGLKMSHRGYSCGTVEGHILEQSSPSFSDVANRNVRYFQGFYHILFNSTCYSLNDCKIFTIGCLITLLGTVMLPNIVCNLFIPVYVCPYFSYLKGFALGFTIYGRIFVVLKHNHQSWWDCFWRAVFSAIIGPFLISLFYPLVICKMVLATNRLEFYITKKIE